MNRSLLFLLGFIFLLVKADSVIYLGCYKDQVIRDLNAAYFTSNNMTVTACVGFCTGNFSDSQGNRVLMGQGLPYAAVQTNICFCGYSYGFYGRANPAACNTPCPGKASDTCGGLLINSVWKTWVSASNSGNGRSTCPTVVADPSIGADSDNNDRIPNSVANIVVIVVLVALFFILGVLSVYFKVGRDLKSDELGSLTRENKREANPAHRSSWVPSVTQRLPAFAGGSLFRMNSRRSVAHPNLDKEESATPSGDGRMLSRLMSFVGNPAARPVPTSVVVDTPQGMQATVGQDEQQQP